MKLRESNNAGDLNDPDVQKARKNRTHKTISNHLNQVNSMNCSLRSKLDKRSMRDDYDSFFKNGALMKLPSITQPLVNRINAGSTIFIANNDAHSKESNFGYKRNEFGGFYSH